MATFMEEGGVEARSGHYYSGETLRLLFMTIAFCQGSFPHYELSSQQIHNSLNERHILIRNRKVYLPGTVRRLGKNMTNKYPLNLLVLFRKSLLP